MKNEHAAAPDYIFLCLAGIITVFGFIALASASSIFSYENFGSSFYLIRHQLLFGFVPGLLAFFVAMRMHYTKWKKLAGLVFLFSIVFLALVLIPGIGSKLGGSRSWFTIGAISFQPAEVAKLGLILYLALWFEARQDRLQDFKQGFVPFALIVGILGIFIVLQPDVGTLSIIGAVSLYLAFVAGMRLKFLAGAVACGFAGLVALIKFAPYRAARLASFIHPELDPQGIGYHINQALLAVGSGGFWGVGFGNSRQKFRYLPEVIGDSIFPIIAEEMGFIVSALLIILIAALIWRMFYIAARAPDNFSKFVVIGIAGWFGIQSFVNIGSMVGVLPMTGLPLPLISYGGTALAVELLAIGIVGSISRAAK